MFSLQDKSHNHLKIKVQKMTTSRKILGTFSTIVFFWPPLSAIERKFISGNRLFLPKMTS
jgi:hypothetical protein